MKLSKKYFKREIGVSWFTDDRVVYIWITLVTLQFQVAITFQRKVKKERKNEKRKC